MNGRTSHGRTSDDHPKEDVLHRLAAGDLDGDRATEVRRHVRRCEPCRSEVEAIRRVLRAADALPEGIAPERDLWPGVEARVRTDAARPRGRTTPPEPRGSSGEASGGTPGEVRDESPLVVPAPAGPGGLPLRRGAPWLAAAAAVLVAVTAGLTLWLADGSGPDGRRQASAAVGSSGSAAADPGGPAEGRSGAGEAGGTVPAPVLYVRTGYRPMVERLGTLLEAREEDLPPEVRRTLERNLGIIDAAIAETEAALAENPSSPDLLRSLDRTYDRKVELLRRSTRLAARM